MSVALQNIQSAYQTDDTSEDEFPELNSSIPVVPDKQDDQISEQDFLGFDERELSNTVSLEPNNPDNDCARIPIDNDVDSDGSFFNEFEGVISGPRKRSKKVQLRLLRAKKRRLAHSVKFENCECKKDCSKAFAKDDRIQENSKYWNDITGQAAFIRERVHRMAIKRRQKNRHTDGKFKMFRYQFNIMSSNGELKNVCRKFFLNTIGFSQTCGYVYNIPY